jgi:LysM repeat protein
MKRNAYGSHAVLVIGAAAMAGLLMAMSLLTGGQAAQASGAADSATATPSGATVALAVVGAPANAWTSVQWQDGLGQWHDVEGWQGTLNTAGQRVWWAGNDLLGNNGLYRWVVYQYQGGPVWATSLVFHFPAVAGQWAWENIYGPDAPAALTAVPTAVAPATSVFAPATSVFAAATSAPALAIPINTSAAPAGNYTVQAGDTLYGIALRFQTTISALQAQNGLSGSLIFPGQVLALPGGSAASVAAPVVTPLPAAPTVVSSGTSALAPGTYVVQRGDTLFRLALRFGTTASAIQAANQLYSSLIQVGQTLVIP